MSFRWDTVGFDSQSELISEEANIYGNPARRPKEGIRHPIHRMFQRIYIIYIFQELISNRNILLG
ncbi:MAG: hypothetical protein ACE5I5_13720 [Candidatus Heimdallarchaeota archaeon]